MTVDNLTALNARDDWLWLVAHWTDLRAKLRPGGGNALNGMPASTDDGHAPIDVHVSDLMRDIEEAARFYAHILWDETDPQHGCAGTCHGSLDHKCDGDCDGQPTAATDCPERVDPITTSHMPGLLRDVAERYGHFTTDDELALGFCDDAHELRRKAARALERPEPPTYLGPCRVDECAGDVYARPGHEYGSCHECGSTVSLMEQRDWLDGQLETRLMTPSEITSALKVLDLETPHNTVKSWIQRRRLPEVADGLYRLADAKALAENRGRRVA